MPGKGLFIEHVKGYVWFGIGREHYCQQLIDTYIKCTQFHIIYMIAQVKSWLSLGELIQCTRFSRLFITNLR